MWASYLLPIFTGLLAFTEGSVVQSQDAVNCSVLPMPEDSHCQLYGGYSFVIVWINPEQVASAARDVVHTVTPDVPITVTAVVNTILNTTTYDTQYPSGYKPPATNTAGTRVETVTYYRHSQALTTVIAYPTPFISWADDYSWTNFDLPSGTGFMNATPPLTSIPLSPTPQFSNFDSAYFTSYLECIYRVNPSSYSQDPLGLNYSTVGMAGQMPLQALSSMWPNQPAITSCEPEDEGPDLGDFTMPWLEDVEIVTTYVGGPTTTPSIPLSSVQPTIQVTSTPLVNTTTSPTGNITTGA